MSLCPTLLAQTDDPPLGQQSPIRTFVPLEVLTPPDPLRHHHPYLSSPVYTLCNTLFSPVLHPRTPLPPPLPLRVPWREHYLRGLFLVPTPFYTRVRTYPTPTPRSACRTLLQFPDLGGLRRSLEPPIRKNPLESPTRKQGGDSGDDDPSTKTERGREDVKGSHWVLNVPDHLERSGVGVRHTGDNNTKII